MFGLSVLGITNFVEKTYEERKVAALVESPKDPLHAVVACDRRFCLLLYVAFQFGVHVAVITDLILFRNYYHYLNKRSSTNRYIVRFP